MQAKTCTISLLDLKVELLEAQIKGARRATGPWDDALEGAGLVSDACSSRP